MLRILLSLLLLITSCTTTTTTQKSPRPSASAQAQKIFSQAQEDFDKGNDSAAQKGLLQLLSSEPSSDLTDDANLLLGRIDFRRKNFDAAYEYFAKIFTSTFYSPKENEARILGVQCLIARDKNPQADRLIRSSLERKLSNKERAYLLEAHLPILLNGGSQLETFEALAFLAQHHPNPNAREKYKSLAKNQIDSHLKPDELKSLSENSELGEFRVEAMFQYGMELVEENKLDSAQNYFQRIVQIAPNSYLGEQSRSMLKQLEARSYVEIKSIGVILPLSGNYKGIGQQVLHGIQQALGISGAQNKFGIKLTILDSMDSPEEATRAVDKLVLDEHVIAIIGGLTAKTSMAEVTRSQELGTPFISLSQSPGLTKAGPFVFRGTTTPQAQVTHLVAVAMNKLNIKSFAILYPNDRYGVEFSNLFWDEVLRNGGTIAAAQAYQPGETDFKDHIKKMVGTYYIDDRKEELKEKLREWHEKHKTKRKKPPEDILPPIVNFEALFIPDSPMAIGQIAPMLAYNDVRDIYLLGTNLWNSPDFIRRGQNFVTKSVFLDLFLSQSDDYLNSNFYRDYKNTYSAKPGSFAVLGFDSGKLVLSTLERKPQNRIDFLRILTGISSADGAVSKISMGENREIIRPLLSLTVDKGKIVPLQ